MVGSCRLGKIAACRIILASPRRELLGVDHRMVRQPQGAEPQAFVEIESRLELQQRLDLLRGLLIYIEISYKISITTKRACACLCNRLMLCVCRSRLLLLRWLNLILGYSEASGDEDPVSAEAKPEEATAPRASGSGDEEAAS